MLGNETDGDASRCTTLSTVAARLPTVRKARVVAAPARTATGFGPAIARASGAYAAGTGRIGSAGASRSAARNRAPADAGATPGIDGDGAIAAAGVIGAAVSGAPMLRRSSCVAPGPDGLPYAGDTSARRLGDEIDVGIDPTGDGVPVAPAAGAGKLRAPELRVTTPPDAPANDTTELDVTPAGRNCAAGVAYTEGWTNTEGLAATGAMFLPNRVRGPVGFVALGIVVTRPSDARRTSCVARARAAIGSSGCDRSVTARCANAAAIGNDGTGASASRDGIGIGVAAVAAAAVDIGNPVVDGIDIGVAPVAGAVVVSGKPAATACVASVRTTAACEGETFDSAGAVASASDRSLVRVTRCNASAIERNTGVAARDGDCDDCARV